MELIATCAFGLEKVLYQEIKKLGLWVIKSEDGRVIFQGEHQDMIKANLWLRTAERIQIKIAEFPADNFDDLFDQTFALDWLSILPENATFPVLCSTSNSALHNEPAIQSIVKKAIVKKLQTEREENPLPETGPTYTIQTRFNKDICTIAIDTSGESLHKRGYRTESNLAPIKETLAAALVLLSDWTPEKILIDPFCGSGTILIEAAMVALNMAPGLNRTFAFEEWESSPPEITEKLFNEAYEQRLTIPLEIYGTDLDSRSITLTEDNAKRAGLENFFHLENQDFKKAEFWNKLGKEKAATIVTNPPYGERLSEEAIVEKITIDLGQKFSQASQTSLYIITPQEKFEDLFGQKAAKNRKLYNGKIKCYLYQYPLVK